MSKNNCPICNDIVCLCYTGSALFYCGYKFHCLFLTLQYLGLDFTKLNNLILQMVDLLMCPQILCLRFLVSKFMSVDSSIISVILMLDHILGQCFRPYIFQTIRLSQRAQNTICILGSLVFPSFGCFHRVFTCLKLKFQHHKGILVW